MTCGLASAYRNEFNSNLDLYSTDSSDSLNDFICLSSGGPNLLGLTSLYQPLLFL